MTVIDADAKVQLCDMCTCGCHKAVYVENISLMYFCKKTAISFVGNVFNTAQEPKIKGFQRWHVLGSERGS